MLQQFRDPQLEVSGDPIGFYPREFYVLDNFSSFQVFWHGRLWATVEHAYHAAKYFGVAPEVVEKIANARSAHEACQIGRSYKSIRRPDWAERKVQIMEEICRCKMTQHEYVRRKLLETGDLLIVEDSPKDAFWGWGPNRDGRNELGKIWMRLRDELRAALSST